MILQFKILCLISLICSAYSWVDVTSDVIFKGINKVKLY